MAQRLLAIGSSFDGRATTIVQTSAIPEMPGGFLDDAQLIVWWTSTYKVVTQNGTVESFNGRMCDELLNKTLFTSLAHAREALASWADDYNAERPHSALGYATPAAYAAGLRLAALRAVATVADDGDNTRRSLVATG